MSFVCSIFFFVQLPFASAGELLSVAEKVTHKYDAGTEFPVASPLSADSDQSHPLHWGKRAPVADARWLSPDHDQLAALVEEGPEHLRLQLPLPATENKMARELSLDLVRAKVLSDDFVATTSEGALVDYVDGVHYRGIVDGREDTMVAISLYEDKVMAVIHTPEDGDMVLGPYRDDLRVDRHVFYKTGDLTDNQVFICGAQEGPNYHEEVAEILANENRTALVDNCVQVYLECDYALYQERGSNVNQTLNWVTGMYNVVAAIYQNEQITTTIKETKVWTTRDSYSRSSSSQALNQFQGTNHNSDLAHLLARGGSGLGGVAWVNVLCNSNYGYAYSNIGSSYSNLPNYSWTVGVVAHEMGHNLGSPHTHSCSWPGGALDNCYTPEGNCSPGPAPPSSGGTVMSYCHLTSAGIDLTTGFGPVPGNLIRNRVSGASCLTTCGGGGENNPPSAGFTSATSGLTASFTDTSSDSDGTIASRSWNFGDGGTSSATNPNHTYASAGTYTVTLTVTDDDGASDTHSASVTVTDGGGGGGDELQNGVPVSGLSAGTGTWLRYTIQVPAGATNLTFALRGNDPDADMYIRRGSEPSRSQFDCRSWSSSSNETCTFDTPDSGVWHVGIYAYSSFAGLTLTASFDEDTGGDCADGGSVSNISDSRGSWEHYRFEVPECASSLVVSISGGSGDADLYVRYGQQPTTSSYDCRPYRNGNNEQCEFTNPTAGTWYLSIRAYRSYSGLTLEANYE
ncbi:pre-peptidase C-terminal domain-containing protein [Sulfidibacter corallicola]|uniref:Pre-peptidase C-terminal domain-containing protein n=1 Tax=Sulfidibacter corallicola TaxID=2818388 RepID=A0A8A4THT5_SULCO|nr:pre-peptidase C-terminal domain-containing protein [Sulfidibacter corallicola]QTD48381.1 pre-peptidase C-terminal domain-containing protein [Sulfidibacter corallicola]